MVYICLTVR